MSLLVCWTHRAARLALALSAFTALSACGGGGDAGPDASPTAQSALEPAPPAGDAAADPAADPSMAALATTTTTTPTALASCGLPGFATEALQRINQRRAAGGTCGTRGSFAPAPALRWQLQLEQAAIGHTQEMARLDRVSHTSADGRTLAQRVTATGYPWSSVGENIAAGQRSVASVVDGWMRSDGHCANLMAPGFRDMALACVDGAATTRYGRYWTLVLARPR